jgi:superfamily II DNA/RNA helicase
MSSKGFADLGVSSATVRALAKRDIESPFAVQDGVIPDVLEGHDVLVKSPTGSGKTLAFGVPLVDMIKPGGPRPAALVLAPTRELASQIADEMYGIAHAKSLSITAVYGGVGLHNQAKQASKSHIIIATPGRLIDLIDRRAFRLDEIEVLVLDEADRMLDMGFIDDITTIADHVPKARQTVMYSATFLGNVARLAQNLLREPQRVDVASHTDTHANIEQRLHWADNFAHKNALLDHILTQREVEQALVFTSTQIDADRLADRLAQMGHAVASLHGGMPQGRRNRVLQGLRSRQLRILVATDVAARGIDVPTISHVVNYGLPMKPEDYVHRIGRTGRAGRDGLAVTLAERMDAGMIRRIQQFTTQPIPVATIVGLEPKTPAPKVFANAPAGRGRVDAPRPHHVPRPSERRAPFAERTAPREFAPRAPARGNPFDRALPVRDDRAAPARRPGPAAFKGRGKPQRPRVGGFSR